MAPIKHLPKAKGKKTPIPPAGVENRGRPVDLAWLCGWLICLLPMVYLGHLNHSFGIEWINHTWVASYVGEYMRVHWSLPVTLNADRYVGMPQPLFYGYLFYPVAGFAGIFMGGDIGLRAICAAAFLWQGRQVLRTAEDLTGNTLLALGILAVVNFATYPLTNLYNRAAVTEFAAVCLLVSVLCMWLRLVFGTGAANCRRLGIQIGLCFALAAGTHPITAVLGSVFILLVAVTTLPLVAKDWKRVVGAVVPGLLVFFLIVAPWMYVAGNYARDTSIGKPRDLILFDDGIDTIQMRLWPVPRDMRVGSTPFEKIGTPYLDSQINIALLLLTFGVGLEVVRQSTVRKRALLAAGVSFILFLVVVVASTSTSALPLTNSVFSFIQFAYRLVTYCDLFLLLTMWLLILSLGQRPMRPGWQLKACVACAVVLSALGLMVKSTHVTATETKGTLEGSALHSDKDALLKTPASLYWVIDYAISKGMIPEPTAPVLPYANANFPVGKGEHFGEIGSAPVVLRAKSLVITNGLMFPWNRVVVNGAEIPSGQSYALRNAGIGVVGEPGYSQMELGTYPSVVWLSLRFLSFFTLVMGCGWLLWTYLVKVNANYFVKS